MYLLGVALVAYFGGRQLRTTRRPLAWFDTTAHYVLWVALLLGAVAFTAAPRFAAESSGYVRETPSILGHVGGGARWSSYAFVAPPNHRVRFWVEWLKEGQPVSIPGMEFETVLRPARHRRMQGVIDFTLLIVRGDADRLEVDTWDPAVAGRSDYELRLKARLEPVPAADLAEAAVATTTPTLR